MVRAISNDEKISECDDNAHKSKGNSESKDDSRSYNNNNIEDDSNDVKNKNNDYNDNKNNHHDSDYNSNYNNNNCDDNKSNYSSSFDRDSYTTDRTVGTYELNVRPILCNLLGRLHGGALAMSIEHTARMYRHPTCSTEMSDMVGVEGESSEIREATITKIEIMYKAAMQDRVEISCCDDYHDIDERIVKSNIRLNKIMFNPYSSVQQRSTGEVFNRKKEENNDNKYDNGNNESYNKKQEKTKENNEGIQKGKEKENNLNETSAATFTCYWSKCYHRNDMINSL